MKTKITLDSGYSTNGEITLKFTKYYNGRTALTILDGDVSPFMTCTVNLPEEHLPEGYAFIKDYSENSGILHELLRIGMFDGHIIGHHTIPNIYIVKMFPLNLDNFNGRIEK